MMGIGRQNELDAENARLREVNAELLVALRDLLNTYSRMIGVPVEEIVSGVGGQARAVIATAEKVKP